MKKFISTVLLALMAIGAEAQVTWNVRAGGGLMEDVDGVAGIALRLSVQSNVPFGNNLRWVFSPTVGGAFIIGGGAGCFHVDFPLLVGYKAHLINRSLFIPKIGPVLGYVKSEKGNAAIAGPAVEFAFEIGHFIAAVSGYYSVIKRADSYMGWYYDSGWGWWNGKYELKHSVYNISLTLGYKF